jgi:hypothetical protein
MDDNRESGPRQIAFTVSRRVASTARALLYATAEVGFMLSWKLGKLGIVALLGGLAACGRPDSGEPSGNPLVLRTHVAAPQGWQSIDTELRIQDRGESRLEVTQQLALAPPSPGGALQILGKKLWEIVGDNQISDLPDRVVHVLPHGVAEPIRLTGWKQAETPAVKAVFEDLLGDDVSDLRYRVDFLYGGSLRGKGRYLSNVTLIVNKLEVKSLYLLSVKVRVLEPINVGTEANPVVQLRLLVEHRIKDRLLGGEKMSTDEIRLDGNGGFKIVHRSNEDA